MQSRFFKAALDGKNDWWRFILTMILVVFGWQFVGIVPILAVAMSYADGFEQLIQASSDAFIGLGIPSNLYLFAMILMFVAGLLFLFLGVRFVHHKKIRSIMTGRPKVDWKRFFFGLGLWLGISVLALLIDYALHPEDFILQFEPEPFLILLLIGVLMIPLQTSFEELLFRGYLMQGFGLMFRNSGMALLVTSVCFGLLHIFNPEVQKLGNSILIYYVGTGLLFGIVTLMDEGTELALGMHAANNMAAAVFVTMDWAVFQTDALFKDISEPSLGWEMFLPVFIIYPLVILYLGKRYKWSGWKTKLMGKIDFLKEENAAQLDS